MEVFADECVNRKLLRHLAGHTFVHARNTALLSKKNGARCVQLHLATTCS